MVVSIMLLAVCVICLVIGMLQDYLRYLDHEERIEDMESRIIHEYYPLIKAQEKYLDEPLFFDLSFDVDAEDYEDIADIDV